MVRKEDFTTYTDNEIYKLAETINASWQHKDYKEWKEGIELELRKIQINSPPEMVARLREQLKKMKYNSLSQNEKDVSEVIQRTQDEINLEIEQKFPNVPSHDIQGRSPKEALGKAPENFNVEAFNARLQANEAWVKADKAVAAWKATPTDENRESAMNLLKETRDLVNKARGLEGTSPLKRSAVTEKPQLSGNAARTTFDNYKQLKSSALNLVKQYRQDKTEVNRNKAVLAIRRARQSLAVHNKVKKLEGAVAGNQQQMALINKLKSELPKIQRIEVKARNLARQYHNNKTPERRKLAIIATRELRQAKSEFRKMKNSLIKQHRRAVNKQASREASPRSQFRSGPR